MTVGRHIGLDEPIRWATNDGQPTSNCRPWVTPDHHVLAVDEDGATYATPAGVRLYVYPDEQQTPYTGRGAHVIQRDAMHRHSLETEWLLAEVSRAPLDVLAKECGGWTREVSRVVVATFSRRWWREAGDFDRWFIADGFESALAGALAVAWRNPLVAGQQPIYRTRKGRAP